MLVGSNPSRRSPDNSVFHASTRSRMTVDAWFRDIECQISFTNVSREKTENNRPLTVREIRSNLPRLKEELKGYDKIVALGNTAQKALTLLCFDFFAMPHPSGLNRLLNDPIYIKNKIKALHRYIENNNQRSKI